MTYVYATAEVIRKVTDKALLAVIDGEEVWLPLSQLAEPDQFEEGDTDITIGMTHWIAEQKGIEGDE